MGSLGGMAERGLEWGGMVKAVLAGVVIFYGGLMIFAVTMANRMIFPAPESSYEDGAGEEKVVYNEAGEEVTVRVLTNPGARWVLLYHHGNGEDLGRIDARLEALRGLGFVVVAYDYPGYGTSDGKPTEGSVRAAAEAVWRWIPERTGYGVESVVQYGRSVGGGPAIWLASEFGAAGLIVEGTFTSTFRVMTRWKLLPFDIFDNLSRIGGLACPLLILHGTDDDTVAFWHGERLLAAAPEPKFFGWFAGGGHNNLVEDYWPTYRASVEHFREYLEGSVED